MICGGSARSTLKGPPGAKRIRKKEMVTTMKIVGTALNSRRSTKRSIPVPQGLFRARAALFPSAAARPGSLFEAQEAAHMLIGGIVLPAMHLLRNKPRRGVNHERGDTHL